MRAVGLLLLAFVLLAPAAAADPWTAMVSDREGVATWTFSNPANYTLTDVSLSFGEATLARISGAAGDTDEAEFAQATLLDNVDLAGSPGDVRILNTSEAGPGYPVTHQPPPAQIEDNYLRIGNGGNTNFGSSPDLLVGYWGVPEWNRAILRFPSLPLPANATILTADLELYMHTAATPDPMQISVHRMTTSWLEFGSTWNDYDGSNPWNSSGGDFDPAAVDAVAGVTTSVGWYSWNVTSLVSDWWTGAVANQGLIVRQADDDLGIVAGRKGFSSGDASNASARPRLHLTYALPGSGALLESRVLGPGTSATWGSLSWNATLPPGTSVDLETRTGDLPAVDGTWSPWSAAYASSGSPIVSPGSRYLQYRARLSTTSGVSPVLHGVSVTYSHLAPNGSIVTQAFLPARLEAWRVLAADWSGPAGTDISASYSQDGGNSWTPASLGGTLASALPRDILFRIDLATDDTTRTPVVQTLWISFAVVPSGGGLEVIYLPVVGPFWLLLIPVILLAAWSLANALRRPPFDPTDLFLIHSDGRLVLRIGAHESPLADDHAVSAMFTLVADFVKDSFRTTSGGGGDLRSFQVDERQVAIAKGEYLFLALVGEGTPGPELGRAMDGFLRRFERVHRAALFAWDGFSEGLGPPRGDVERFLRQGYRNRPLLSGRFVRG